jgi:chemotaxis-related protein WspB
MLLLTFTAAANSYAVDVTRVVELIPRVELRPLPHAPLYLAGLLSYRGRVVPVIDFGLLLGGAPCRDCLSTRIILVNNTPEAAVPSREEDDDVEADRIRHGPVREQRSDLLGLIAEQVSDLTQVEASQVIPTPVPVPGAPYLDVIVPSEKGLLQLIAVDKIRDAALRSYSFGQNDTLDSKSDAGARLTPG